MLDWWLTFVQTGLAPVRVKELTRHTQAPSPGFLDEWGEYATEVLSVYQDLYEEAAGYGENPVSAISTVLLHRWLGDDVHEFDVRLDDKKTGILSPLAITHVEEILLSLLGGWKQISENFEMVEGDLPPDFDEHSLGSEVTQPQCLGCHSDMNGKRTVSSTGARGAERTYKTQIKGPWRGVKEKYWPLSEEDAEALVDQDGIAHAVCFCEKGEPKYALVVKRVWERMDDVGDIMRDPILSDEERIQAIKRLNED